MLVGSHFRNTTMRTNIWLIIFYLLFGSLKIMAFDIQVCDIVKVKSTNDKADLYTASIIIINNTDKIVRFWAMTCSWQDTWITNDKLFWLIGESSCDSNFPDLIELKPNQSKSYSCKFEKKQNVKNKNGYRVGFVWIREKENSHRDNIFRKVVNNKISKTLDVTWSQPFYFN